MLHNEARKLLIQALERSHNVREVARNYCVNRSTVYRLKKRLDEIGSIETRTYLRGRKPALTLEEVENINQLVKTKPDITMQEIIETLHLTVSNETVRKTVRQLGYRRKKKSLHASEQERPPDVAQKRKNWNGLISGFKALDGTLRYTTFQVERLWRSLSDIWKLICCFI